MKKELVGTAVVLSLLLPCVAGAAAQGVLPDRYKKWLDEEVVYIITPHERDVFRQLQTDKERDIFIEAFWKHRDPDPQTPRNELKDEHYRRLDYANKFYGRSTPLPGWKTDRGRMYIILGAPRNIEQYTNVNGVYPAEIWFYLGDPSVGLPTGFNLIFFKRSGIGDYVLYSPTEDGPRSLIAESMNMYENDQAAYNALRQLEPNLAPQTLSLIPGENALPGMESLASTKLMATIYSSPQKKVEVGYADAILKYKDFVEVEYTANYISSDACVQVIRDPLGGFEVHYSIEPAKITVEPFEGSFQTNFELAGRVSDDAGRTIYQFTKEFPVKLSAAELEGVRAKSLSIQDLFPLIPGTYTFDILLKNTLSKEFTGVAKKVVVPGPAGAPEMSPLLLAYGAERKAVPEAERVPFMSRGEQLLCQTRKTFGTKDTLITFFQLYGLTPELREAGRLRIEYLKEDQPFSSRTLRLSAEGAGTDVVESQPLEEFPPGYYQARVTLIDAGGGETAVRKENFEVSPAPAVPRPLVMAKVQTAFRPEDELFATGLQYLNAGGLDEARDRLEQAYHAAPQRTDFALAYGQVLFNGKDFAGAKAVLQPFGAAPEQASAEVLSLLGRTCHALGEFREALTYYSGYLGRFGMNIDILNYLGTCQFQLGNREEAVKAWEKSLELAPDQDRIRKLLDSLKK